MANVFTSRAIGFLLLAASLLTASGAGAQQQSREQEAMRRAKAQVSKLQQENAVLQRERTEMEAKLQAAEAELIKVKAQAARLRRNGALLEAAEKHGAELERKLGAAGQQRKDTEEKLEQQISLLRRELTDAQATLVATRRTSEQEIGTLRVSLESGNIRATACEERNRQLYSVTMDLIAKYKENRGVWEQFLLSEPFTGLKSVQVENLLEGMRDRAREARVEPAGQPSR